MDKVVTNGNVVNLRERGKSAIVSASLSKSTMSDDSAKYKIVSSKPLEIKINSTIDIFGKTYRVNNKPEWSKTAENAYSYDVTFEGVMYDLRKCMLFNADDTGFKTDSDFSLIGTIEVFLLCLKNNIKRLSPIWRIGTFENKETKTINFSKDNCLSALQKICQEFKVEFRIDNINGLNVINVGNYGRELSYTFEYGKGKGLYELSSTNVDENGIINRMYVAGGSENLPNNYQNYATNLKLPGGIDYLENADSIAFIGLKEGFIDFPDIFPHRKGVISAIDTDKKVFFDTSMDFDLNEKEADNITTKYLKPDTAAKIHFNTGNLAGYEFEIKKGGYNHATKKFTINQITNDQQLKFPSDTAEAFQFQVGDEYVILDIYYPETYITNAENKLLEKAEEQFPLNLQPKVNYKLRVDENYLKSKVLFAEEVPFDLGDTVRIIDSALNVDKKIKIVSFSRDILNPFNYEIEIADSYEINFASQVALEIIGINNAVNNQTNVIAQNYLNGYRRLNELNSLVFDPDGYFDVEKIKPLSIETNMLSVGAKSQQLTLEGVTIEPNHETENKIKFSAGKLIHFSISDTIKEWNFIETVVDSLVPTNAYYVYAKCEKLGSIGHYHVTEEKIQFDSKPTYYYFLLGVLHKVNNGFRFYTALEGATMINGRYITTGKIQSVDNLTWFDLDLSAFDLGGTAGMTGRGTLADYFLWAGSNYTNRQSAPFGVTKDGLLVFRNDDGQIIFEVGLKGGKVAFNIYNDLGVKVAEIGSQGIVFTGYISESYSKRNMLKLTTSTFEEAEVKAEIINALVKYTDYSDASNTYYLVGMQTNDVSFFYSSGRNFESAGNAQYEGFYPTENKLGLPIENGIYIHQSVIPYIDDGDPFNEINYTAQAYLIIGGKVTNVLNISFSRKISGISSTSSPWTPEDYN